MGELMMLSLIIPIHHKSLALLNTICPKAKQESAMKEFVVVVVNDNFSKYTRRAAKKGEEFARHVWVAPCGTIIAIRITVKDYENDSRGEGIKDKSYSINVTHRAASYGLIYALLLGDYRKSVLFFFFKSAESRTAPSNGSLINCFILHYSIENDLYTNFLCIYVTLVSMICQISSNLMLNIIQILRKIYGGSKRLLPFKSQF